MEPITNLVIGSWGDVKTAKTTLGLTFPKLAVHFDLDLGFTRAKGRIPSSVKVIEVPWNLPLQAGIFTQGDLISKAYRLPIRFPKQTIHGMLELWESQIIPDVVLCMESPLVKSILFDTGTVMWNVGKDAQLQRAQANNKSRTSLLSIEYATPNQEMRAVLGAAKHYGKNLYIPHHIGGKYEQQLTASGTESVRVGDTWDGWNHLGAIVDVIGRTEITPGVNGAGPTPQFIIDTCGYTLKAEGIKLPNPTFDSILSIINSIRDAELTALETA